MSITSGVGHRNSDSPLSRLLCKRFPQNEGPEINKRCPHQRTCRVVLYDCFYEKSYLFPRPRRLPLKSNKHQFVVPVRSPSTAMSNQIRCFTSDHNSNRIPVLSVQVSVSHVCGSEEQAHDLFLSNELCRSRPCPLISPEAMRMSGTALKASLLTIRLLQHHHHVPVRRVLLDSDLRDRPRGERD